ncbi:MAG: hypothetical protein ACD_78C00197G0003 [uncultured bacterium (gcode 4)]|uniref:Uncharacterized protein n=1 Tax=uncultured bacterium (gcode 4) TaxID=1234023 RepID=K1YCC8_9BACT|nr:MAG: hypothetical protein ACD_78C00197G0003 [uncultured bacterium (gcode 4)]
MDKNLQIKNTTPQIFSNFVIFQTATGKVNIDVYFQDETLWLTQKNMAELFEVNVPAISKHLKNIFETGELEENSVISILETTAEDGKQYKTKYYNLRAILAVGYRVNSGRAREFRKSPHPRPYWQNLHARSETESWEWIWAVQSHTR